MKMLLGIIAFLYIVDVFALVWLSGRFAGISNQKISNIGFIGMAIIMVTWLVGMALFYVPFELKPAMLFMGIALIVYVFVLLLDEHIAKCLAAGLFYVFCQLIFLIVIFREMWNRDFFRAIRTIFFQSF